MWRYGVSPASFSIKGNVMTRITVERTGYLPGDLDAKFEITCDVTVDRGPSHPDDPCGGGWETSVEHAPARLVEWFDEDGNNLSPYAATLRWGPGMVAEFEAKIAKGFTADDLTEHELEGSTD